MSIYKKRFQLSLSVVSLASLFAGNQAISYGVVPSEECMNKCNEQNCKAHPELLESCKTWCQPTQKNLFDQCKKGASETPGALGQPRPTSLPSKEASDLNSKIREYIHKGSKGSILTLTGSKIGDAGLKELVHQLQGTSYETIFLGGNNIGPEGIKYLFQRIKGTKIRNLVLSDNNIGDVGLKEITEHLQDIGWIDLSNNNISDVGAKELGQKLPGSQVSSVALAQNSISDVGVQGLTQYLKNTNITFLILSSNRISDEGAKMLGQNSKGSKLKVVTLIATNIGDGTHNFLKATYPNIEWRF